MRSRRPVPDDIAPAGRLAGYVTAGSLIAVGMASLVFAVPAMDCTRGCTFSQHYAALISVTALAVTGIGFAVGWSVRRRPVAEDGDTGWTWSLGVLFILGMLLIASRVPRYTCPPGVVLDSNFGVCIDTVRLRRYPPGDWIWIKRVVVATGWLLGLTVIRSPRWVRVAAPVAAAAWLVGAGWLLVDSFVR